MSLVDKAGGKHKVTAEVLRMVTMPFPSRDGKSISVMHETLGRVRLSTDRRATGSLSTWPGRDEKGWKA
jgi:hypothetical protein